MGVLRNFVKKRLRYSPLADTKPVRDFIASAEGGETVYYPPLDRYVSAPYCPPAEGDLIHSIVTQNACRRCLETGFASGSTALYILNAVKPVTGTLVSVDVATGPFNHIGRENLARAGLTVGHRLVLDDAALVLPQLYRDGEQFDFIYMDGWKTFDHLAVEVYYMARVLSKDGFLMFDDAAMPSVKKVIKLLVRYYQFHEVDYARYNQPSGHFLYQMLTTRRLSRPYRAFQKTVDTADLPLSRDWNFFEDF